MNNYTPEEEKLFGESLKEFIDKEIKARKIWEEAWEDIFGKGDWEQFLSESTPVLSDSLLDIPIEDNH